MLFPVLLSNLQRLSTAFEKKKNTQSTVFISILSDFNRVRDVAKRPGDVCSATTEAERRPRTFEPWRDSKTRKGYPFGYPFLVPLRARDVAKRPGDVCSATTEAERRPRTFEPRRGSKTRKGYPFGYPFLVPLRARDGTRTRGPDLGKVVLHQLSHSRIFCCICKSLCLTDN
jgi:hypothetical protein